MDEGRGGGCSFDIEAAMAQVVTAGRQSLKEEEAAALGGKNGGSGAGAGRT